MNGEVRLCPQCGSPNVDFSTLAGGNATCKGCRWTGTNADLVLMPFTHDFISDESMLTSMVNDLRQLLSGALGLPYLKFLLKWGFLTGDASRIAETLDRKKFSRYLIAISTGILTAVLAERAKQATANAPEKAN